MRTLLLAEDFVITQIPVTNYDTSWWCQIDTWQSYNTIIRYQYRHSPRRKSVDDLKAEDFGDLTNTSNKSADDANWILADHTTKQDTNRDTYWEVDWSMTMLSNIRRKKRLNNHTAITPLKIKIPLSECCSIKNTCRSRETPWLDDHKTEHQQAVQTLGDVCRPRLQSSSTDTYCCL